MDGTEEIQSLYSLADANSEYDKGNTQTTGSEAPAENGENVTK